MFENNYYVTLSQKYKCNEKHKLNSHHHCGRFIPEQRVTKQSTLGTK